MRLRSNSLSIRTFLKYSVIWYCVYLLRTDLMACVLWSVGPLVGIPKEQMLS